MKWYDLKTEYTLKTPQLTTSFNYNQLLFISIFISILFYISL
jgi:hypothetical protein